MEDSNPITTSSPNEIGPFSQDRTPKWFLITAGLLALGVNAATLSWRWRLPDDLIYTGFIQYDLPYYCANARELFENGNGLFYANPFSSDPQSPRFFSHLFILLVGWTWRLTGLPLWLIFQALGVIFGFLMLWTAYRALAAFIAPGFERRIGALLILFGGGITWLVALAQWPGCESGLAGCFKIIETPHAWWFLNVERNLLYPTETFYHTIFFLAILFYAQGKYRLTALLVFLQWWSHSWTGLELNLILGADAALRLLKRPGRPPAWFVGSLAATGAAFLGYHMFWLPRYPEMASLMEVWSAAKYEPAWWTLPCAYGALWIGASAAVFSKSVRDKILSESRTRFILVWALVVFALIHHHLVFGRSYQPMHFTHGYLYFPLLLLTLIALHELLKESSRAKKALIWSIVALASLPDNFIFLNDAAFRTVPEDPLVVEKSRMAALEFLQTIGERRTVLALPDYFGYQIALYTRHRPYIGHLYNTPLLGKKFRVLDKFMNECKVKTLTENGIELLAMPNSNRLPWEVMVHHGEITQLYHNEGYSIYRVNGERASPQRK